MQRDLTTGSILKNIGIYALPYLISYFLQTLYGLADLFFIGKYDGAIQIAAVSIGSQVMHFLTVILVGLTVGTTVLIGRAVGSKKSFVIKKIIGNTVILFSAIAIIFTLLFLLLCQSFVSILKTPIEAASDTTNYLTVCFIGLPFIIAYNVIAAIFRGLGDSKSPMYFITIACVFNVLLDYLLIGLLHMGATGAALATVCSQAASVGISVIGICKRKINLNITKKDFKIQRKILKSIAFIGMPIAFQDGFIQVSFLLITAIANSRGLEIATAVGIVEKIICFLFLVPSSMLSTISAISAQNLGAKKIARAKQTLFQGILLTSVFGIFCGILFQFISESVISIFTSIESVIQYGTQYLRAYIFDCLAAGIHFCFSGFFTACKKSVYSFFHNALSIMLFRIPGAYLSAILFPTTLVSLGLSTLCGSIFSAIVCLFLYAKLSKANKKI